MTDMRTDLELMLIEHLDFDVPCQMTRRGVSACEHAAAWLVTATSHCKDGATSTKAICATHYGRLMAGAKWRCIHCDELHAYRDNIIRTERIKP